MKLKTIYIFLAVLFLNSSCISDLDDWLNTSDIGFHRSPGGKYFTKDYVNINLTKFRNELTIDINLNLPDNFNFPVSENDTLSTAEINFQFFSKGKALSNNYHHCKNERYNWFLNDSVLEISSERIKLYKHNNIKVVLPMYVFNCLKAGSHEIEMKIATSKFTSDIGIADTSMAYKEVNTELISGRITFNLKVPEIFKTEIIVQDINLKSDSAWTPAGMDFSLITPGYPDVYWELFYPAADRHDFTMPYYISEVTKTCTETKWSDTITLFHYYDNARVTFGVYDYDYITRNDFIGDWHGSLNMLATKKGYLKKLAFDNVESFNVQTLKLGVINK